MRASQFHWKDLESWSADPEQVATPGLVLYFGTRAALEDAAVYDRLRQRFPVSHLLGCSTGGQMEGTEVSDDGLAVLTLSFAATPLRHQAMTAALLSERAA